MKKEEIILKMYRRRVMWQLFKHSDIIRVQHLYSRAAVHVRGGYDNTQKYHERSYSHQRLFALIQKRQMCECVCIQSAGDRNAFFKCFML
jgi:hypothetical protein